MSSVSNGLYFLTLLLVSVMRVIYRKIRHARYLPKNTSCALSIHQKEFRKFGGARYTLGARYLSKNTVVHHQVQWVPKLTASMKYLPTVTHFQFTKVPKDNPLPQKKCQHINRNIPRDNVNTFSYSPFNITTD